jgi:hypothetical protein
MDLVGMVNNTYTEDAVYIHNIPFFNGAPPYEAQGREEIIAALSAIAARQGAFEVKGPTVFYASNEHVAFQCIVRSPNTGVWILDENWTLQGGKVARCFAYGYNLTEAETG